MAQVAKPLRGLVAVELQYGIDGVALHSRQLGRVTRGNVIARDSEFATVRIEELRDHWPVGPRLDALTKKGRLIPDEGPRLAIVDELLKLHSGHGSASIQDVGRYIKYAGHRWSPRLPSTV